VTLESLKTNYDIIIIGGGASGFFTAINTAEKLPELSIAILERGKTGLQKVKISGGGRCNVTHAEFIPSELVTNYPRGEKELLGPFHSFMTGDTMTWFNERGVFLNIEEDGRIFPESNSSQTIIDCFLNEANKLNIDVLYNQNVNKIDAKNEDTFQISTKSHLFTCSNLVVATGSNPKIWKLLEGLGHNIIPPVPSLFTFNIQDERIKDIPGVVAQDVEVKVLGTQLVSEGPLLITHVGMSAPAILKLSAFGAIELAKMNYNFKIQINFIKQSYEDCLVSLLELKYDLAKKSLITNSQFNLPKRLWKQLVLATGITKNVRWADCSKSFLVHLAKQLTQAQFQVIGKSTFKEEFVTAGGVDLKEMNFKTYGSKLIPNLYLAGEVLNIDAITGGFNFQNAWTGGYIIAQSI
jgi:predicted Rossmann fold flavoprotein